MAEFRTYPRSYPHLAKSFGGGSPADKVVSYLPDAHAANRWFAHYLSMLTGGEITTCPHPRQVAGALTEVRPTVFLACPGCG